MYPGRHGVGRLVQGFREAETCAPDVGRARGCYNALGRHEQEEEEERPGALAHDATRTPRRRLFPPSAGPSASTAAPSHYHNAIIKSTAVADAERAAITTYLAVLELPVA